VFDDLSCLSCSLPSPTGVLLQGKNYVHKHVGFEPSGQKFNAHVLNAQGLPHNPLINAGLSKTKNHKPRKNQPKTELKKYA
jgi:glutaminase